MSAKHLAVGLLGVGIIAEMIDSGTATLSNGSNNPFYQFDSALPFGLSVGLLLILIGAGMFVFGKA